MLFRSAGALQISSQKEKDLAFQELLTRQRETEGNPVNVFDKNQEEKSRLVDFYEPQFVGQNISPDVFIPQNEKEGQAAYEFMEDGEMDEHIDERLLDIDEFMPGKTFITDEDYADKYNHLRATAPPDICRAPANMVVEREQEKLLHMGWISAELRQIGRAHV